MKHGRILKRFNIARQLIKDIVLQLLILLYWPFSISRQTWLAACV